MTRDVSRKGDIRKAAVTQQCRPSPEPHDFAGHGLQERAQSLEEELQCSRREWNKVAERQFQLEEELRALRKEQEHCGLTLQFIKEDQTVEVGQQLGRLQEDVDAKEKRLSKLEAMLDGCELAAVAARSSDHIGVSVQDLVSAIERRTSIGSPSPAQQHQMNQQLDQQHLMPKHQQSPHDQSQQQQQHQHQQQSCFPWAPTRPLLRHAAGGS
jgi:chromosome segregation ATPase